MMKRFVGVISVIAAIIAVVVLARTQLVFAATSAPQSYLPLTCERSKGNYKAMSTLVVIPLDEKIVVKSGDTAEKVAKSLFFDFAYVRGNNVSPLNAISLNGNIAYLTCDYPDYLSNIVTTTDAGQFILGVYGTVPTTVQNIINTLKITTLLQGELVPTSDEKNTTIALANTKPCGELCTGLTPSKEALSKRDYKLTFEEPNYSKSIRQKELVSFSIRIKNEGQFPVYSTGVSSLYLAPAGSGLSPLYHSSWVAPSIIARIPGTLLPGEETTLSVTIGAPLKPGKYSESLVLKMGGVPVGKTLSMAFTVEDDHYKLARIVSKDGASFANLRTTPSLKGPIAGRLDIGSYVIIRSYQDAWVGVETKDGRVGWVYKPFLREL